MIQFFHERLPYGLDVIMEQNPDCSSCAVGFFVKAGSRNETAKIAGISHFLEHMSFKGTSSRTALDINFDMGKLGAQANAFTSDEFTVYYGAVLPENLVSFLDILVDMQKPLFDKKEFDLEKKVVLEEIALYKDKPQYNFYDTVYQDFFAGHPIGNSVLGTVDTVSKIEVEDMKNYHSSLYTINNIVLAISGNFDKEKVVDYLQNIEDKLNPKKEIVHPKVNFTPTYKEKTIERENLSQCHLFFLINGVSVYDEDRYALSLLADIFGDYIGSKLYWELVYNGICESAEVDTDERLDGGAISFYAATTKDNLEFVEDTLIKHINNLSDFTNDDLQRAKTKIISKLTFSSETPLARLIQMGKHWHFHKEQYSLEKVIKKINDVTKEDIVNAILKLDLKNIGKYRLIGK